MKDKEIPQWEIDLRNKLRKELPDGAYDISSPGLKILTGKGGKIEYEVSKERMIRKFINDENNKLSYIPLTKETLYEFILNLFKSKKDDK